MGNDLDVDLLVSEMEEFEQLMKASRATEYSYYSAALILADQMVRGDFDPEMLEYGKQLYLKARGSHERIKAEIATFWRNNDA